LNLKSGVNTPPLFRNSQMMGFFYLPPLA
jgi:hypothetical protein